MHVLPLHTHPVRGSRLITTWTGHISSSSKASLTRASQITKRRLLTVSTVCATAAHTAKSSTSAKDAQKRLQAAQFDEASITVRSGSGGRGEISDKAGGKMVDNFKYKPGGNMSKRIFLPNSDPADGAEGSSVVLYVDPGLDSLAHLHERKKWSAPNGAAGSPAKGSNRPRTHNKQAAQTAPLRIPVPPGTVVRRKRGAILLADLTHPGASVVVARGGKGGMGVNRPGPEDKARQRSRQRRFLTDTNVTEHIVEDDGWKLDAVGGEGQEVSLQLMLRVVADVGIVGFPNAGKSSLLAALTRASPEVAPYPFTTITPNLGVTQVGADAESSGRLVLADLPGLIEGAHQGRGLGRMFLRHLRRTRTILHVVDASSEDPATDYWAVREELRMYNPEYCARPHVVALNKMDIPDAADLQEELSAEIGTRAQSIQDESPEGNPQPTLPAAIVNVSAHTGIGLELLQSALGSILPGSGQLKDSREPMAPVVKTLKQESWQ